MFSSQDGEVLDLVAAHAAVISALVADKRAVAKEEQVGVAVEQVVARLASEAVDMPTVSGCETC